MTIVLSVILPVFLVIGAGWASVWRGMMRPEAIDGLMKYAQGVAVPCLLFQAMVHIDLAQDFDGPMLLAYYIGAFSGFFAGMFGARLFFGRDWEDCVAIGFVGLFSNSMLLGVAITERAYGTEALVPNFTIIAFHSPGCYALGITTMELVRARRAGTSLRHLPLKVSRAVLSNALIVGVVSGLAVNLSGLTLPVVVTDAVAMLAATAIPAALFGLGGVLYRYRPEGDMRTILFVVAVSLVLHPAIVWGLGRWWDLSVGSFRSAVLTAAMAPGVNAYLFADMYGRARRVAASAVLIGTACCILSVTVLLLILP